MRGVLVAACLLVAVRGQIVPSKPAREADNAATLYTLAIAEVTRDIKSGRLKLPAQRLRNVLPANIGQIVAWQLAREGTTPDSATEELQAVARSVLARSLFQQASARPVCHFGPAFAGFRSGGLGLQQLVTLIGWHSRQVLAKQPVLACEDAFTMLRYVRHRRPGLSDQAGMELGQTEQRALQLLHGGLEALRRNPKWPEHVARFTAELDLHAQSAIGPEDYRALFCRGIPELVNLHRPRLRDMHMKIAGGFEADKMTRHIEVVLAKIFATPSSTDVSLGQWLNLVNQRTITAMKTLPETAGVTEKATFGMLQLALMSVGPVAKSVKATAQWTEQCQHVLRLTGTRR